MRCDVGVVFGEFVDNAAIGGVEVDCHWLAGLADFFDPAFGLFRNAVGALTFVVGDVDVDARKLCVFRDEGLRNDMLKTAKVFCILADE